MMTLLIPLGLLGLLSIVALIVIYIIKPNYQQKVISSTFVWKLSLKYKKKRLPISKLRNILLILCQVLTLVACAMILSQPALVSVTNTNDNEVIAIIDSSASMRAEVNEETRYERAVKSVMELTGNVLDHDGVVSVILAADENSFLAERVDSTRKDALMDELDGLISDLDRLTCSYSSSDVDGALTMCEDLLLVNPSAQIYVYTDVTYAFIPEGIKVVNVSDEEEWNAAILNAYPELEDGYYSLVVEMASYGIDTMIDLKVDVNGANAMDNNDVGVSISFTQSVTCSGDTPITVIFRNGDKGAEDYEIEAENIVFFDISSLDKFYSYKSINLSLDVDDALSLDNTYEIYGGQKEVLKVQYASSLPNKFVNGALAVLRGRYEERWDVQITEVKEGEPATEGYDFYIFEHTMPKTMPTDGVVFLFDMDAAPSGSGVSVDGQYDLSKISVSLTEEQEHPLLNKIVADDITVSRFNALSHIDPNYEVLMACEDNPVMLVKNTGGEKVLIAGFSVHYSNFSIIGGHFMQFFLNTFEYFFPATVSGHAFEVNETIALNCLGEELTCSGVEKPFTEFPAQMSFYLPGTYSFKQTTSFGKHIEEYVFVKIPAKESNILEVADGLSSPYKQDTEVVGVEDLLLYFAIALVSLLFIEWLLQAKENF